MVTSENNSKEVTLINLLYALVKKKRKKNSYRYSVAVITIRFLALFARGSAIFLLPVKTLQTNPASEGWV